ncbi:hypothetical protein [Sinorhizobium sp. BG8]|uniref:hypothetical protein n=1 Tax=Sinorhizobium sp. BG8 TaxID=2613773 RepID=UPI00193D17A3|nr:hypothetical protein [Sinorhizobium sp. BG8]QRM56491.1 hypothetical protein F3Y30_19580 [Sinorhizobium sp. BG8]
MTSDPDDDLEAMPHAELLAAAKAMRVAIRAHRDATGHDLCWHHPHMWNLLPDLVSPEIAVPDWPQFMRGCVRYRQSLDEQLATKPRTKEEFNA